MIRSRFKASSSAWAANLPEAAAQAQVVLTLAALRPADLIEAAQAASTAAALAQAETLPELAMQEAA